MKDSEDKKALIHSLVQCGLVGDKYKAYVLGTIGDELGIGFVAGATSLFIKEGQIGIPANCMYKILVGNGVGLTVETTTDKTAIITFTVNQLPLPYEYNLEAAKREGHLPAKPDTFWHNYVQQCLLTRCLFNGARAHARHVFAGFSIYGLEELDIRNDMFKPPLSIVAVPGVVEIIEEQPASINNIDPELAKIQQQLTNKKKANTRRVP